MSLGEFYADYDEPSQLWCVFHTEDREPHAYSSFMSEEEAAYEAEIRNQSQYRGT